MASTLFGNSEPRPGSTVSSRKSEVESLSTDLRKEFSEAIEEINGRVDGNLELAKTFSQALVDEMKSSIEELRLSLQEVKKYAEDCGLKSEQMMLALKNAESGRKSQVDATEALETKLAELETKLGFETAALREALMEHEVSFQDMLENACQKQRDQADALHDVAVKMIEGRLDAAVEEKQGVADNIARRLDAQSSEMNKHFDLLQEQVARCDSHFTRANQRLEEEANRYRATVDARLAAMCSESVQSKAALQADVCQLREGLSQAASLPTRRVEWLVTDACQRLNASQNRTLRSPAFCTCGLGGVQLQLRYYSAEEKGEGPEGGNCQLSLCVGVAVKLTFRLSFGPLSTDPIVHEFDGTEPHSLKRGWFLDSQLGEDGSLRLGVEILECSRIVTSSSSVVAATSALQDSPWSDGNAGGGDTGIIMKEDQGELTYIGDVSHQQVERVEGALQLVKSYMLRRIVWKVEQASTLRLCYSRGESICSVPFLAHGIEGFQLVFYPLGASKARQDNFSLFYTRPKGSEALGMHVKLRCGSHAWDASEAHDLPDLHGRVSFGRLDQAIDSAEDVIVLIMEIHDSRQDTLEISSQQDPWRTPKRSTKAKKQDLAMTAKLAKRVNAASGALKKRVSNPHPLPTIPPKMGLAQFTSLVMDSPLAQQPFNGSCVDEPVGPLQESVDEATDV